MLIMTCLFFYDMQYTNRTEETGELDAKDRYHEWRLGVQLALIDELCQSPVV